MNSHECCSCVLTRHIPPTHTVRGNAMLFQFAFLFVSTTKPRTSAQLRDAHIDDRQCALARDVSAITDHQQLRGHAYRWSFAIAMAISMSALCRACWARHMHKPPRGKTAHASGCAPPPPSAPMFERAILCVLVWAAVASGAGLPPIALPPTV